MVVPASFTAFSREKFQKDCSYMIRCIRLDNKSVHILRFILGEWEQVLCSANSEVSLHIVHYLLMQSFPYQKKRVNSFQKFRNFWGNMQVTHASISDVRAVHQARGKKISLKQSGRQYAHVSTIYGTLRKFVKWHFEC